MTPMPPGLARTVFFMGRPGSGKETQARLMAEKTGFHILSTGEKFRELREHRDALGQLVKQSYDTGRLLPSWFADYLFEDAILKMSSTAGIILEGSGRTVVQAERIHEILKWLDRPYRVLHLAISEAEATRRQQSRAQVMSRPESDTAEKIRLRLEEFTLNTLPAIHFFESKGAVIEIDGERDIEAIHAEIMLHFTEH